MIDSQQASDALSDIDEIVRRVRQSRIYNIASRIMMMWGVLVFIGNSAWFLWPRYANYSWLVLDAIGVIGWFAISASTRPTTGVRSFDFRKFAAFLLLFAFGLFTSVWLGHFSPRQMGTFWAIYCMQIYTIAGLWFGHAFVVIGLGTSALTLIGYFLVGETFPLWMAVANGGGMILGGLWMRRS